MAAESLLARAKSITGWSSSMLGQITGLGTSTVTAYCSGRLPEYLSAPQLEALRQALRLHRDTLIEDVAAFEMFD